MIRYHLACDQDHGFESWFPSSASYDEQAARGLVTCPICGSSKVHKAVMAPSVARTDRVLPAPIPSPTPAAPPVPAPAPVPLPPEAVALISERERAIRTMLKAVREHVMQNAENVGDRFADEARRMHHGEVEERSIYGQADPVAARELLEEGIEIMPLPQLPDEHN